MARNPNFFADDHIWPDGKNVNCPVHELDRDCWCKPEVVQVAPKLFSVTHKASDGQTKATKR